MGSSIWAIPWRCKTQCQSSSGHTPFQLTITTNDPLRVQSSLVPIVAGPRHIAVVWWQDVAHDAQHFLGEIVDQTLPWQRTPVRVGQLGPAVPQLFASMTKPVCPLDGFTTHGFWMAGGLTDLHLPVVGGGPSLLVLTGHDCHLKVHPPDVQRVPLAVSHWRRTGSVCRRAKCAALSWEAIGSHWSRPHQQNTHEQSFTLIIHITIR